MIRAAILVLLLLLAGCGKKETIDKKTLVKTYVDLTIAKERYSIDSDSLNIAKDEIFAKYPFTEEEYNSTIQSLEPNVEYWNEFFDMARNYLDSLKQSGYQP